MPIIQGWEVSTDRDEMYTKMMSTDQLGDPIITSKCLLVNEAGFLIASNNGFAWRIKITAMRGSIYQAGKSKWVRWHDVASIVPKKPGQVIIFIKKRKDGALVMDKKGNPKLIKWRLTIKPNKNEPKEIFIQRQGSFAQILTGIFNQYKGTIDPPTSDSRI